MEPSAGLHAGTAADTEPVLLTSVAVDAERGLAGVAAWLSAACPAASTPAMPLARGIEPNARQTTPGSKPPLNATAPDFPAEDAAALHSSSPSDAPCPARVGPANAAGLVAALRAALDALSALGEALEAADPVAEHDAVQAVGLASAVLEEAHGRLLRAGLAAPRSVDLLGS
jgi:hypothetical protein